MLKNTSVSTRAKWYSNPWTVTTLVGTPSEFKRTFFANETSVSFLKTFVKSKASKRQFPFVYEYSVLRINKKTNSTTFESLLKVRKSDAETKLKKVYPKLLSFYDLMENDAEVSLEVDFCKLFEH